ncbi:sugar ABC transporter substrate-binding protein [Saccharothrix longispora]|uniref:ABC transporter substrate-binding protein n=1 Tax=Saccharothrix longispora TaxID=33920 RepID=UPI0028FD8927|nr:sugar ABC transporter substrate-binding protein [Saccharothrix longispora]MDU0289193.1 sugar ABC transporter substrate-binding protein [Saccharothrix longispora]
MRGRALLAVATLLTVTACTAEQVNPPEQVTLTWWDYLNHSPMADQAVDHLLARYQQEHPGVQVRRTSLSPDEFEAKLVEATTAGTFPDVAAVDTADVPRLAARNALADLTPRFDDWALKERFLDPVREGATHDGRFYGVPLRTTTTALIHNRELFAAAGVSVPPVTWEELRVAASTLTTQDRSGLCFPGEGDDLTTTFLPFLWQAGGDVASVGDPAGVTALTYVDQLVNTDRSAPAEALTWTAADAVGQFAQGRCGMLIGGPEAVPELNQAGLDWAASPLPGGRAGTAAPLGGEVWVVGRGSKQADRAWDLLTWLAEERDNATEFGGGLGALPNRTDTLDDLAWQWDPNVTGFAEQLPTVRARTAYGPEYPRISEAISTMAARVLTRERDPAGASADAAATIGPLLR